MNLSAMSDETTTSEPPESPKQIDLDGLFILTPKDDGTFTAHFGKFTAHRERAFRMGLSFEGLDLLQTLVFFASDPARMFEAIPDIPIPAEDEDGQTNIHEIFATGKNAKAHVDFVAICVVSPFVELFGDDLKISIDPTQTGQARSKARKEISKRFGRILESIEKAGDTPRHGSAAKASLTLPDGAVVEMPAPWLLLYVARDIVQATSALPSKGKIRLAFESRHPSLSGLSERKWNELWAITGLSGLSQGDPWAIEAEKRTARARTKKR